MRAWPCSAYRRSNGSTPGSTQGESMTAEQLVARSMQFSPVRVRGRVAASIVAVAALAVAVPTLTFVAPARAGGFIYVTTTAQNGTGGCSLGEAILSANEDAAVDPECAAGAGDDTIVLLPPGGVFPMSAIVDDERNYVGPTATPAVTSTILIEGAGARLEHVPNGVNFRAFAVAATGSLTLRELYVKGFTVKGGNGAGGGGGGLGAG